MNSGLVARSLWSDQNIFMKLSAFVSALTALVVVLLAIGLGGFFWLFSQNPLSLLQGANPNTPQAAIFVSRQAPLMVSLLVNPDRLAALRTVVAKAGQRQQAKAEVQRLQQALLANTGLEYERDVQPWLGEEVTLAITTLDVDRDATNGRQPGYLLALSAKQPELAREFLQLYWQKRAIAGVDLVFEPYEGVRLIYGKTAISPAIQESRTTVSQDSASLLLSPTLATAIVGEQFVLFASDPKVLRAAINNVQAPDLSLKNAPFYQQAIAALTQPRIALSLVNLAGIAQWWSEETTLPGLTPPVAEKIPSDTVPETLAVALGLDRQGLLAETALLGHSEGNVQPRLSQFVDALQYVPSHSPIVAVGIDLNQLWQSVAQQDATSAAERNRWVSQPLENLKQHWQIDLPQDVFHWVTGEYAIALLPQPPSTVAAPTPQKRRRAKDGATTGSDAVRFTPLQADWVFVAQRQGDEATTAIAHLDELARQQGLSVGPVQLENQTVSAWTRLSATPINQSVAEVQAAIQGVHAKMGNYEVFATSLAAMETALKAMKAPLSSSQTFAQAIAPLRQPNHGYLYLDWPTAAPILEQQIPFLKILQFANESLTRHLRSLTFTSYGREAGIQRGGVFIRLG